MDELPPGSLWPASDFGSAQIREVYARYGLAMYMAQVLEHAMVNAVIVMRTLPAMRDHADETSWHATFDSAFEAGLARTYGNMLRQLETLERFPSELLDRLRVAKEDRDILAHRFFRQNDLAFMNPNGRTSMIAWCEERVDLFKGLSDDIEALLGPIQAQHGITREWVDAAYARSLEEARNWTAEAAPS